MKAGHISRESLGQLVFEVLERSVKNGYSQRPEPEEVDSAVKEAEWVDAIAEDLERLESDLDGVSLDELRPHVRRWVLSKHFSDSHRWNERVVDGRKQICRGDHHRSADCVWEPDPR